MKALTDLIIALADLLEAEVKMIRRGVFRLVFAMVFLFVGSLLVLGGIGLACYSLYLHLAVETSASLAALLSGVIFLLASIPVVGVSLWLSR